jgi:hypothetical protein
MAGFLGCKQGNNAIKEITDFKNSYNITGEVIGIDFDLFFPKKMTFINDSILALTEGHDDYSIKIVKMKSDSAHLFDRFGHKGEGPGEVHPNVNILQKDVRNGAEGLWIGDTRWIQFHPYNPETGKWEEKYSEKKPLPKHLFPSNKCFLLDNDDLLGSTMAIQHQVYLYSPDEDRTDEYDFYPVSPNPYDVRNSKIVFNGDVEIKPDKSKFVFVYEVLKSIGIVSLDNLSEPVLLRFKDTPFPPVITDIKEIASMPLQYMRLYTTDQYIYALYAGKTVAEIEQSEGLTVHVFKWDGTAHCELHLNTLVNCFCVDEKNGFLYGINPMGEDNSTLYRFSLPKDMFN